MEDRISKLPLPANTSQDDAGLAAVKGIAGAIPVAGAAIAEVIGFIVAGPLAKRRDAWFHDLEQRLRELETQIPNFSAAALANDEAFTSVILQASAAAVRTHQKEKLSALRNAVVNSAVKRAPDENKQALFIGLVDRLTPAHLRILGGFHQPPFTKNSSQYSAWHAAVIPGQPLKSGVRRLLIWIREYVHGMETESEDFLKLLVSDLYGAGLIQPGVPDLNYVNAINWPMLSPTDFVDFLPKGDRWTTDLGEEFLLYIAPVLQPAP